MKISSSFKRICRKAGGLFLGARVQFPVTVAVNIRDLGLHYGLSEQVQLDVGLVLWQLTVTAEYNYREAH